MTVGINTTVGVAGDWVNYLTTTWVNDYDYRGHGFFSPTSPTYNQWAAGDVTDSSETGVVLNGSFTYAPPGGFSGTLTSLEFGDNLTGSASAGYDLDTVLTLDLSGATATTAFTYAIYYISNYATFTSLWTYLGEQGTTQVGLDASDDTLYSFSGNDTLTGVGATDEDTFVFNSAYSSATTGWGNDTITDFVDGNDAIQFVGYWSNYTAFDAATTIANNANGDAVISYTDANSVTSTITLIGVDAANLDQYDFIF